MTSILLLALSLPTPTDGDVSLSDGDRFGLHAQTARYLWKLSEAHADVMRPKLQGWNSPETLAEWEMECRWRARCYYLIDDVLYCSISVAAKLRSLRNLKRLIGDEAYYGGRLPAPVCSYRPRSD